MIITVGLNHRTAPIEVREKLWISSAEMKQFVAHLRDTLLDECFIVSTCNRTEIYGVIEGDDVHSHQITRNIIAEVIRYKSANGVVSPEHFHRHENIFAIRHLLSVAAGLDSLVLGDVQILNQIRQQFSIAREMKTAGKTLHRLMGAANRVGERVRRETEITAGAVSVSYAAVELAVQMFPDLKTKSTLLIGAGETGERAAKHISARDLGNLYVANRTIEKALELTKAFGGYVVDWNDLRSSVPYMDVIISSVSSPNYILTKKDFYGHNKRTLIIDISVPRSVDPSVNLLDNVELYDLDSLNHSIEKTLPLRKTEVPKVERIVEEELETLNERLNTVRYLPKMHSVDLRGSFEYA